MANLQDLEQFASDVVPILKALFTKASEAGPALDPAPVNGAIATLEKLVAESSAPTAATNVQAAETVTAVRGALFEVIKGAAGCTVALPQTDLNTMDALFIALESKAGLLLEQGAFEAIPVLISPTDVQVIQNSLQQAQAEIKSRQQAKDVLDAVIKTIIIAAQIASKVAA